MDRQILKFKTKNFYDLQQLRIQSLSRTVAKDVELSETDKRYFDNLGKSLKKLEKDALAELAEDLECFQIYSTWLKNVRGVGPTMASVLLSEFDIYKATTVSKLWAFAGLSVVNGSAPKPVTGEKLKYNSWLRSKLVGVLADSFIKSKSPYAEFYNNAKNRYTNREKCNLPKDKHGKKTSKVTWLKNECTKGHVNSMAKRYMIKMFLKDLYLKWREVENLPIRPLYQEEYLGHKH